MAEKENHSICSLAPGQEENAFKAVGPFDLEPCGPFMTCSHRVEKINFVNGRGESVELFYCAVNWYAVGALLFVVFLVYLFIRRRARSSMENVLPGSSMVV